MGGRVLVAVAVAAALAAAGCGSSSKKTATSSGGGSSTSSQAGGGIKVKPRTIGVDDLAANSPADASTDAALKAAGQALGWNVQVVDAGADVQKFAQTASTFVTQGVDAIIFTSGPTALATAAVRRAKAKGIPVLEVAGGVGPDANFDGYYHEDEPTMAKQLIDYILKKNPSAKIGDLTASIITAGKERDDVLKAAVKANGKAKIVASGEPDLTDPVGSGRKITTDMLTAHPEIDTMWSVFDNFSQAALTAMRSKGTKAKLYSFFGTPQQLKDLRSNTALEAVSDVDIAKTGLVAMDQLVNHFQKGTPLDKNALQKDPLTYRVVDRSNVPQGDTTFPLDKLLKPFTDRWSKEYKG